MSNCSIWLIYRTLQGATTPGQGGPGSDGNEGVLRILQSTIITGTSLSDYLMSYPGHSFGGGVLCLCREAIRVFYSPSQLDKQKSVICKCRLCGKSDEMIDPILSKCCKLAQKVHDKAWQGWKGDPLGSVQIIKI